MKVNKGSGQKSLRSKLSHEKKLSKSGVKNTGMQNSNQAGKRSLGQMNIDEEDIQIGNKKEYNS
ncbi:hypothetical protein SHI21_08605 [Bacteriovorax sp. PP10]|uniref:Uncharacterized protein n=1 Tax=Bacteriovorax antarcticus TaxID=3088717 RepID=A0ABU5VT81_9BACT|nr:hypothetical protein [Bacteriovorax sp. PP10]MEA9356260.1 hypothetical protein [Bacteriovorax sp. PP10]